MFHPPLIRWILAASTYSGAAFVDSQAGAPAPDVNKLYDYVIVGGGTAGLAVASRLTENRKVTVAVIEAGGSVLDNPLSYDPGRYVSAFGTPIDWNYHTSPQPAGSNRVLTYNQGKAIGGSSAVNGYTYIRPAIAQLNAWERLGNPGVNWDTMYAYMKKAEGFITPTAQLEAGGASYVANYHNTVGPINTGWTSAFLGDGFASIYNQTWTKLGLPWNRDPNGGDERGFGVWPMTANANTGLRSDAARAYYWPFAAQRPNLVVFANTTALRLVWDKTSREPRPSGVRVSDNITNRTATIKACKEVIVSLGTIKTPSFLEHSGIGNPSILKAQSVDVKIDLPAVGENLQDQPLISILNLQKTPVTGLPTWSAFGSIGDVFTASSLSSLESSLRANIPSYAQTLSKYSRGAISPRAYRSLMDAQADLIFSDKLPVFEASTSALQGVWIQALWNLLPFSRGSVHIGSRDAAAQPVIDPNLLALDFDLRVQIAATKLVRRAVSTPPLSDALGPEVAPGLANVPANASDEVWEGYIRQSYVPTLHPIGTASMKSRDLGGVVDSKYRVYGAKGLRVVDASIMPTQICGHLTSIIYGLAERAAEIIKADWND